MSNAKQETQTAKSRSIVSTRRRVGFGTNDFAMIERAVRCSVSSTPDRVISLFFADDRSQSQLVQRDSPPQNLAADSRHRIDGGRRSRQCRRWKGETGLVAVSVVARVATGHRGSRLHGLFTTMGPALLNSAGDGSGPLHARRRFRHSPAIVSQRAPRQNRNQIRSTKSECSNRATGGFCH